MFSRAASIAALALFVSSLAPVFGASVPVHVVFSGHPLTKMVAFNRGGTVFVELGSVVKAFDGLVVFDGPTATVSIGRRVAIFTVGSARANLDGTIVPTGGTSFDLDGDRYVPLAFFTKSLARASIAMVDRGTVARITRASRTSR